MNEQSKRTVFEWFAQILVPLVLAILAVLQKQQRGLAIGLVILAVVSSLVSGVPRLMKWFEGRKQKKQDRLNATAALDDLKERIHKFLEFSSLSDGALYELVFSRLCGTHDARFQALRLGPPQLFADFSRILATRTDERKPSMEVLKQAVDEFNGLVGMFSRHMVCPLYEKLPEKLSTELLENYNKQELGKVFIQFRERYDRFVESYLDFTKNLDRKYGPIENAAVMGYFWRYIERPKPLGDNVSSTMSV
jgi:hypothetical protein